MPENDEIVKTHEETSEIKPCKPVFHKVKAGDTARKLAFVYLGDDSRWKEILRLNNLMSDILFVGHKLKIPNK